MELRGDPRPGGKVSFPRKREKLVLVLKLSVGDVSGERLADLLNNSDLVRAVKAENLRLHWISAPRVISRITAQRVTERCFHCGAPTGRKDRRRRPV